MIKNRPYRELLLERLSNPEVAKHYLNVAIDESIESFLEALMNVTQARQVSTVAKDAGIQRETLYRSLSGQGNPTLATLSAVLNAVGLKISISLSEVPADLSVPANNGTIVHRSTGPAA